MKLTSKPYNLLLFAIFICLIISIFSGASTLDFHIHDTVFVIAILHVFITLALLFFIFWFIYKLSHKILLSKTFVWIHIIATLTFLIAFFTSVSTYVPRYNPSVVKKVEHTLLQALAIAALLSQILFLFNILGGLVRHLSRKR